jgi:endonuclease/exonuclease/phosphatase family metal-dependent hydrolase
VWALGPEWVEGRLSYAQQTARVIADVLPSIAGPVVLAGDLNAPIQSNVAGARQHADSAARLLAHGLISAFTVARGDADPLTAPTLYHQWKAQQAFHIDHAFVPKEWTGGIELSVGSYADWVATKRSDHVPLIIDLPLPGITTSSTATI